MHLSPTLQELYITLKGYHPRISVYCPVALLEVYPNTALGISYQSLRNRNVQANTQEKHIEKTIWERGELLLSKQLWGNRKKGPRHTSHKYTSSVNHATVIFQAEAEHQSSHNHHHLYITPQFIFTLFNTCNNSSFITTQSISYIIIHPSYYAHHYANAGP